MKCTNFTCTFEKHSFSHILEKKSHTEPKSYQYIKDLFPPHFSHDLFQAFSLPTQPTTALMFLTLINSASSLTSCKWNLYSMYSCYELLHHVSLTQSMTDIYASSAAEQYIIVWMYFVSAFSW